MSQENEPQIDPTLPQVVQNFLQGGGKLESIRLSADGVWTHMGARFENERVINLFSRSVNRTEGGTWILEVGRFTYPIEVEDAGFFVETVDWHEETPVMRLSDGTQEPLKGDGLVYEGEGRLYHLIRGGKFKARLLRGPYYKLMERLEEREGKIYLKIGDESVALATVNDEGIGQS